MKKDIKWSVRADRIITCYAGLHHMGKQHSSSAEIDNAWLILRLLGECKICGGHKPIHPETNKTAALLVYLALEPGPHHRHQLADLLWGNLPEDKALRALRRALWNMRRFLCDPAPVATLQISSSTVTWNPHASCWIDVQAFQHCIETGALAEAVALYAGDLLDSFYVNDAPAFEEWLLSAREHLRSEIIFALQRLSQQKTAQCDYAAALTHAQRILQLEEWREEAHREVMRLLALSGQRSAALMQYEKCRCILTRELGVQPAAETRQLYEQIARDDEGHRTYLCPAAS
jgi:DNA-binding SARP family transcriptional activator